MIGDDYFISSTLKHWNFGTSVSDFVFLTLIYLLHILITGTDDTGMVLVIIEYDNYYYYYDILMIRKHNGMV